jgi:chaperonin cofactor prefoldin
MTREQLERRLALLHQEFQDGQKQSSELETRLSTLRGTLQRIEGAIHVLEQLLAEDAAQPVR